MGQWFFWSKETGFSVWAAKKIRDPPSMHQYSDNKMTSTCNANKGPEKDSNLKSALWEAANIFRGSAFIFHAVTSHWVLDCFY